MIQLAVVAGVAAALGGVVALGARDARLVVVGLVVAMVASPIAAAPVPTNLTLAFRIVGAVLAGYLLWVAARSEGISSEGSGIGILAQLTVAGAAFVVGWIVAPVKPLAGPVAAQAAGLSLMVLAVAPAASRDVFRVGTALALMTIGVSLLLQAWVGPASGLEQIVLTALMVGFVGATSLLISSFVPRPANALTRAGEPDTADMAREVAEPDAAPSQSPPEPKPARLSAEKAREPAPARARRTASPRALRQAAPRAPSDGEAAIDEAQAIPSQPPEAPVESTVRRLRPREPRR
ncbi:MAG: hypothetical protein ABSE58_09985 [Candidatus Limnocylindrales bacterium]|jgi:hypothetical protein